MPGVKLNRDINGEGLQVSIRGLGPSFSKVLLNNTQIAIASDGGTNGGSSNREVDLDFFPSELFTRLDVAKSPVASTLEGGIAGTVNLRNARPFDNPGQHVTLIAQGQYTDSNQRVSPRGAIVASKTWDNFGVLVGVSGVKTKTRVDGFETIGWTDANLACGPNCNGNPAATAPKEGNGFSYASVTPNNVGHGLIPGTPLDLAATSGLSLDQLSKAIIPRLGRNSFTDGDALAHLGARLGRMAAERHAQLRGRWHLRQVDPRLPTAQHELVCPQFRARHLADLDRRHGADRPDRRREQRRDQGYFRQLQLLPGE